jgi:hypothetical protein
MRAGIQRMAPCDLHEALMLAVVKRAMAGELVMFESTGLSRREWEELKATFDLEVA